MCTTRRQADYVWDFRTNAEVGTSLALLDGVLACRGYQYVAQVAGEHAIWVHRAALASADRAPIGSSSRIPQRVLAGRGRSRGSRLHPLAAATDHLRDIVCNVTVPVGCPPRATAVGPIERHVVGVRSR